MANKEETRLLNNNSAENNARNAENYIYLAIKIVLAAKFLYYNGIIYNKILAKVHVLTSTRLAAHSKAKILCN
jgi:hypothetical protein